MQQVEPERTAGDELKDEEQSEYDPDDYRPGDSEEDGSVSSSYGQVQVARKRQVLAFSADAPVRRKRLDDDWMPEEVDQWASTIEYFIPPRPREVSSKAVIAGTLETSLGIRRALRRAGLELVAESVTPDTPGNYLVS